MQLLLNEARKQRSFREVWVGCLLALLFLSIFIYTDSVNPGLNSAWFQIQQDIHRYVGALTAFLLVIGLSRLMCYETEQNTAGLIGTAAQGPALTWGAKSGLAILYCAVVVFILGAATLGTQGMMISFRDAFAPVSDCVRFEYVPLSNLSYCAIQYVFLLLGALYFTGFILIVAAITKHTVFTISLCGGLYLASLCYQFVINSRLRGLPEQICTFIFRFSFCGFMQLESYCWSSTLGWTGRWENIWKPIVFVLLAIALEFAVLWLLWRRKSKT